MIISALVMSLVATDPAWIDRRMRLVKQSSSGFVAPGTDFIRSCEVSGKEVRKLESVSGVRIATATPAVIQGKIFEMVQKAEAGEKVERDIAMDLGTKTWMAFYTTENGKFHEVTLRSDGAVSVLNLSPEAEALRILLDRVCGD